MTRLAFSQDNVNLQVAWDSTSLGAFKRCPRYYQLSMVLGWEPKKERVDLTFGIHYHAALEEYDKALVAGKSHDEATREAVRKALTDTWLREEWCYECEHDVNQECIELNHETGKMGRPWIPDNPNKNRLTLIRSVIWYTEHFKNDTLQTMKLRDGSAAVELSFRMKVDRTAPDGQQYMLCGHMDKVAETNGEPWVIDRKTSKSALTQYYYSQFSPNTQMSLYTVASKIVLDIPARGVIIDAAQLAVNFTRFGRGFAHRSQGVLDEYYHNTLKTIEYAERCAEENYWPQNDSACSIYGGCAFREVCSASPSVRGNHLHTDFTIRDELWDPLKAR